MYGFPNDTRTDRPATRPTQSRLPPIELPPRSPRSIPPPGASIRQSPSPRESVRRLVPRRSTTGRMQPISTVASGNPEVPPRFEGVVKPQLSPFSEDPPNLEGLLFDQAPREPQVIDPSPQAQEIIDSPVNPMTGSEGWSGADNTSRFIECLGRQLSPLPPPRSANRDRSAPEPPLVPRSREMPPPPSLRLRRDQSFPPLHDASLPENLIPNVIVDEILRSNVAADGARGSRRNTDAAGDTGNSRGISGIFRGRSVHQDHDQNGHSMRDFDFGVDPVDRSPVRINNNENGAANSTNRGSSAAAATEEAQGGSTFQDVRSQPERDDFKTLEAMIPGFHPNRWASTRESPVVTPNKMIGGEELVRPSLSLPPPPSSPSQLPSRVGVLRGGLMTNKDTRKRLPIAGNNGTNSVSSLTNKRSKHEKTDPSQGKQRGGRGGGAMRGFKPGDEAQAAVGRPEADLGSVRVGNGKPARADIMDTVHGVGGCRGQVAGVEQERMFSGDLRLPFPSAPLRSSDDVYVGDCLLEGLFFSA